MNFAAKRGTDLHLNSSFSKDACLSFTYADDLRALVFTQD